MREKKIITGVTLDREAVEYLSNLGHKEQRSRSFLINAIVLEHAKHRSEEPLSSSEIISKST